MRVQGWKPDVIKDLIEDATAAQFDEAADVVAAEVRRRCPVGTVRRPMYRRGPYKGQFWTARDGGELKRSVRVVRSTKTKAARREGGLVFQAGDVRVYIGHAKAFYARIVEYYTPFVRPALDAVLPRVKSILGAK
jgi:hypothetical protein